MSNQFNVESLETRTFLSAAQISYPDFASTANLVMNGYSGNSAAALSTRLPLTENEFHQSRSVWFNTAVPIERFRTDFTFRSAKNVDGADGLTFAIINGPTSTLGADGRGLGFGNIKVPSEAVAFNQFNFGKFGSTFGFASNGERPPTNIKMPGINLHSGHIFKVTVTYDGKEMQVAVVDGSKRGETFIATQALNLTQALETSDAIVGFTGATGANRATQEILSWSFSGDYIPVPAPLPVAPVVAQAAAAAPALVTTKSTTLSVLGSDLIDAESALTYTWAASQVPSGAKTPAFSQNASNAAKSTSVQFSKAGTYRFVATITNSAGLSATSNITVRVESKSTYIGIDRHEDEIRVGQKAQFNAMMYDQFRKPMRTQPTFTWAVNPGPGGTGVIDQTGLFKAGGTTGHLNIAASADGLIGTVGVLVTPKHDRGGVGAGA
ncbi:hypothetical protein BH09PLA1_BH09PLA1_13690 [soil metagenome]